MSGGSTGGADIRTFPDEDWLPVQEANQSAFTVGLCEKCSCAIQPRERHERRLWAHGPAEVQQHLTCPTGWKR